jgi:Domain of unknown function (DUF4047)
MNNHPFRYHLIVCISCIGLYCLSSVVGYTEATFTELEKRTSSISAAPVFPETIENHKQKAEELSKEIIELDQLIVSTSTDSSTNEKISTLEEMKNQLINKIEELEALHDKVEDLLKEISTNQSKDSGYKEVIKYVEDGLVFIKAKVTHTQQSVDLKKDDDVILTLQKTLEKAEKQKVIEETEPKEDSNSVKSSTLEEKPKSTDIPKTPGESKKTTEQISEKPLPDHSSSEQKNVDESVNNDIEATVEKSITN